MKLIYFFKNIGIIQSVITFLLLTAFVLSNFFSIFKFNINNYTDNNLTCIVLIVLLIYSIYYIVRYRPRNIEKVSGTIEFKKIISLCRELNYTTSLVISWTIIRLLILNNLNSSRSLFVLGLLIIVIRMYFSVFSIIVDIGILGFSIITIIAVPVIYAIGIFNISWWALISGVTLIWNFLNSKDFLVLLNRGKEVSEIPPRIKFIWLKNKFLGYILLSFIYLALLISSFYEKKHMDVLDKAIIRIYTFEGILIVMAVIFILVISVIKLHNNSQIFQSLVKRISNNWLGTRIREIIEFYRVYHRNIIDLNVKRRRN